MMTSFLGSALRGTFFLIFGLWWSLRYPLKYLRRKTNAESQPSYGLQRVEVFEGAVKAFFALAGKGRGVPVPSPTGTVRAVTVGRSCCCVGGLGDEAVAWPATIPVSTAGRASLRIPHLKETFPSLPFPACKRKTCPSALSLGILVEQFVPSGPHLMLYSPKTHSWTDLTHWHYTTMYLFFLLSGIVDVVSHSPLKLPLGLDQLSLSVALFMEGERGAEGGLGCHQHAKPNTPGLYLGAVLSMCTKVWTSGDEQLAQSRVTKVH